MQISKIGSVLPQIADIAPVSDAPEASEVPGSFSSFLQEQVGEVDKLLQAADSQGKQMAVGKTENLHEAMIGFEKAETALKLLLQVRNKAMEAYNQVLAMQV